MSLKKLSKDQLIRIIDILTSVADFAQERTQQELYTKHKAYRSAIQKRGGLYEFIPLYTRAAIIYLIKAYDTLVRRELDSFRSHFKFLDAGCGVGNIMLLASEIGFTSYGLEIDPTTICFAKKRGIRPDYIIRQDILTYKCYNDYDVIYFYRPIIKDKKQTKFEKIVKGQMKLGAILIAVGQADKGIVTDKRFKKILVGSNRFIYQKIRN